MGALVVDVGFEVLSWGGVFDLLLVLSQRVRGCGFVPDVVVGVLRGGLVPARVLADLLEAPQVSTLQVKHYVGIGAASDAPLLVQPIIVPVAGSKVLLVDDIADTGKTLHLAIQHLKDHDAAEVKTATLYYKTQSVMVPDFYGRETRSWVVFPWETRETLRKLQRQTHGKRALGQQVAKLVKAGFPKGLAEKFLADMEVEPKNAASP